MKHAEIKELLPLYIDGGLDRDEVEMIEAHLAQCENCRRELEAYQANFDFLANSEEIEVPETFMASLMEKIELERESIDEEVKAARPRLFGQSAEGETVGVWDKLKAFFKWRMQIPLGALSVAMAAVLLIALVGPLNTFISHSLSLSESPDDGVRQELYGGTAPQSPQLKQVAPEENSRIKFSTESTGTPEPAPAPAPTDSGVALAPDMAADKAAPSTSVAPAQDATPVQRKIIQTANLQIEVKDLKNSNDKILILVDKFKGFVASSNNWVDPNNQQFSSFTLRIPVNGFYPALSQLEKMGLVKQRTMGGQDVTEEYIDVDSRLKNLKLQEERYREILAKASKVQDVLDVERELERVRAEIESLQNRMNYLNNQVSLATIDVQLSEPQPITSSNVGIFKALRQSLRAMVDSFYSIIVHLGTFLPYLILLVVIFVVYRQFRRKK